MPQIGNVHFYIDESYVKNSSLPNNPANPYIVNGKDYREVAALIASLKAMFAPGTPTGDFLSGLSGSIYITNQKWPGNSNNAAYVSKSTSVFSTISGNLGGATFLDVVPEVKTQTTTDSAGNTVTTTVVVPGIEGLPLGSAATAFMDIGKSNLVLTDKLFDGYSFNGARFDISLERCIFHELAHAKSADVNRTNWTYKQSASVDLDYTVAELVAIEAENLAYARNAGVSNNQIRVGHGTAAPASANPTLPFETASHVTYGGAGKIVQHRTDGGTLTKQYRPGSYNVQLGSAAKKYTNYVTLTGEGTIVQNGGALSALSLAVLTGVAVPSTTAGELGRLDASLLKLKASADATVAKLGALPALPPGLATLQSIDPQKLVNIRGLSSIVTATEAFWTGPYEIGSGSASKADELYLSTDGLSGGTLLLGASGARALNVDFRNRTDYLVGGADNDMLVTGTGARNGKFNVAVGGAGDDVLVGNTKNDDLRGGDGSDSFVLSLGVDKIDGGAGQDALIVGDRQGSRTIDLRGTNSGGSLTLTAGSSTTTLKDIEIFVGNDSLTTFFGNGSSVLVAGSGGGDFTLQAGDTAIGQANSNVGNIYRISAADQGRIKVLNFKVNDRVFVDGVEQKNYTITSKISQSQVVDVTGTNRDILRNASGIQTTISGSFAGSFNSLTYHSPAELGEIGSSAGEYEVGAGTAKLLVSLTPSTDLPNSVVSLQYSLLEQGEGGPSITPGVELVLTGYQDGYGGIRVRSDELSLALPHMDDYQYPYYVGPGGYYWSGYQEGDFRNKFIDALGVRTYSSDVLSPYDALWQQVSGPFVGTAADFLTDDGEYPAMTAAMAGPPPLASGGAAAVGGGLTVTGRIIDDGYDLSEAPATLVGSAIADLLDTQGYGLVVGNGGGDTFVFEQGNGVVWIDEQDAAALPGNLLIFGQGIDPSAIIVFGDAEGNLVLDCGGGDAVVLKGALSAPEVSGVTQGLQEVRFNDGTSWNYSDLVDRSLEASPDNSVLVGDWRANSIDSLGIASEVVGNGGGDTFYYELGYGSLTIDERDTTIDPVNLLAFGEEITPDSIIATGTEEGDILLDLGGDNIIRLAGALRPTAPDGTTYGIQSFTFADGSAWSYQDLIALVGTPTSTDRPIYGDSGSNSFFLEGMASRVVGNGGGDTIFYEAGAGLVTIDERDSGANPENQLIIALPFSYASVSANAVGDIILDFGDGDTIVLEGALNSDGTVTRGVQSVVFYDFDTETETLWTYNDLMALASTARPDNTALYGDHLANVFDSAGIATSISGGGGGDTFIFDRGYGQFAIEEEDSGQTPDNVLQLGSGLTVADLTVTGTDAGDLVLAFGQGDVVTIARALLIEEGVSLGVQSLAFADGTILSYADLLARALAPSVAGDHIYGDAHANVLDSQGIASRAVGGGGGDVFLYARGYGALTIDEQDAAIGAQNSLHFGAGIGVLDLTVYGTNEGDLVVSLGGGDVITLTGALRSTDTNTYGVQELVFADGSTFGFSDLLTQVGTASLISGTIYGDTSTNVLDTAGLASAAMGFGGGDLFLFDAGYGQVVIDERDLDGRNANTVAFGTGIDPANAMVTAEDSGDLLIEFGNGDSLRIKDALRLVDADGVGHGVQWLEFSDGSGWSYADLLAMANASSASGVVYGDSDANLLDAAGAVRLVGNGGGDTFRFSAGDGAVTIYERDDSSYAWNRLLLGAGLSSTSLTAWGSESGDVVLDFGDGDLLTITGALARNDAHGAAFGVQEIVFADRTVWSESDLIAAAQKPGPGMSTLYGSAGADILDGKGLVSKIVGNGGPDTIYYQAGYGALTIDEIDASAMPANRLVLGEAISAARTSIATDVDGNLVLSFGNGDSVTIIDGLGASGAGVHGVQSIEFADGTVWDRGGLAGFLEPTRNVDLSGPPIEIDLAKQPMSTYPALVVDVLAEDVTVHLTPDGQTLVFETVTGGILTLGNFSLTAARQTQQICFADGAVWSIADALSAVSSWEGVGSVFAGSNGGETVDASQFNVIIGGGGGDTILYDAGDGDVQVTQADVNADPFNRILLGPDLTVADLTVTVDSIDTGTLYLDFGNGDLIRLFQGIHTDPQSMHGVQAIIFSDGTTLSYADLMAIATTGTTVNSNGLVGDSFANVLDTHGFGDFAVGFGGGDTFVYQQGYGPLTIREADSSASPDNVLLLGSGITPEETSVFVSHGDVRLKFADDDYVLIEGQLASTYGPTKGVQRIVFEDGTTWTKQQLAAMGTTDEFGTPSIFGDGAANLLDPGGVARRVYGNGGGDTIVYETGYGSVTLVEEDYSANPMNSLRFGAGISPGDVTATLTGIGAFELRLSATDIVRFSGTNTTRADAYSPATGIQRVEFEDGTVWTYEQLCAMADVPSSTHTTLYGDINANVLDPLGIAHKISGGGGGDIIRYNIGYGALDITEYEKGSALNVLEFGAGITPGMIAAASYQGSLMLGLGGADRITIRPTASSFSIGEIRFADGTAWDAAAIGQLLNPTSTGDATHILPTSDLAGAIYKLSSVTGNATPLTTSGSIDFTDVRPDDLHHAVITNVTLQTNNSYTYNGLPLDLISSWLTLDAPVESGAEPGSIGWNFSAPGIALDFLRPGDLADISFTIQLRDSYGNVFDKQGRVYLNGVSSLPATTPPAISTATGSGTTISEVANVTGAYTSLYRSGTLAVTSDRPFRYDGATLLAVTASGATAGLPSYKQMQGWFNLGIFTPSYSGGVERGTTSWGFSAQDSNFDYLSVGQSVTLTYHSEVADSYGRATTVPFEVTVAGANDPISYAPGGQTFAFATAGSGQALIEGAGSLAFRDPDRGDFHSATVVGATASGPGGSLPDTATLMSLLSFGAANEPQSNGIGTIAWQFSSDSSLFSGLDPFSTAVISYQVRIEDNHGSAQDQFITVFVSAGGGAGGGDNYTPPEVSAPDSIIGANGVAVSIDGVSITDADDDWQTVTLIADHGRLSVTSGQVSISGNNGRALTLTGSVVEVNNALGTLSYQGLTDAPDTIRVTVTDQNARDQKVILVDMASAATSASYALPPAASERSFRGIDTVWRKTDGRVERVLRNELVEDDGSSTDRRLASPLVETFADTSLERVSDTTLDWEYLDGESWFREFAPKARISVDYPGQWSPQRAVQFTDASVALSASQLVEQMALQPSLTSGEIGSLSADRRGQPDWLLVDSKVQDHVGPAAL